MFCKNEGFCTKNNKNAICFVKKGLRNVLTSFTLLK